MSVPVVELNALQYQWQGSSAPCLDLARLEIYAGESLLIYGPSGCGKSTLLSIMAGVLLPQKGQSYLLGEEWKTMSTAKRDHHRGNHIGYIFQQFNLLPYLSVLDNVQLPCKFSAGRRSAVETVGKSVKAEAEHWLSMMGLPAETWHRAARTLSVGQQQRVAAARALIGKPEIILADEPTSALDEDRRDRFFDVLQTACSFEKSALVVVSHDKAISHRFQKVLSLAAINDVSEQPEFAS